MAQQAEKPSVAFLGPEASYTHQAALSQFTGSTYTLLGKTSIEEVFKAVQTRSTHHGVVPFENSSNGPVGFTLDLLADPEGKFPDILVEEEIYLPVRHCLVGHLSPSPAALDPTATSIPPPPSSASQLAYIKKLYSHPQAWTQCNTFLSTHFPEIERQDVSSTSRAAELVASDSTGTTAAISSSVAASLNDVPVLAEGIEDVKGNTTRFFVLRLRSSPPTFPPPDTPSDDWKTLVSFKLKQNQKSGALAESLAVFAAHGVNLTSILSRPSREAAWHYVFFVEVQGRKEVGGAVDQALEELGRVVERWRWLGNWESKLKET